MEKKARKPRLASHSRSPYQFDVFYCLKRFLSAFQLENPENLRHKVHIVQKHDTPNTSLLVVLTCTDWEVKQLASVLDWRNLPSKFYSQC